jgi:hypothetical protein
MFADSQVKLPAFVGTRTADDVAAGVISAIERNRAEVDVAPLSMRAGTAFASLAPDLAGRIQRRLGADEISSGLAEAQKDMR